MLSRCAQLVTLLVSVLGAACGSRTGLRIDPLPDGDGGVRGADAALLELCNGRDDDGDGLVDEGLGTTTCGTGACERAVSACVDGVPARCTPGSPADESCNGIDDDCDGVVDDGLGFGVRAGPFEVARGATPSDLSIMATALVATPTGMIAIWNRSFDGSRPPRTNTFARALDVDGRSVGDALEILPRPTTLGVAGAWTGSHAVVAYCGRYDARDHVATSLIDSAGRDLGNDVDHVGATGGSCGAVDQDVLWSSGVTFVGWVDNQATGMAGFRMYLVVANASGAMNRKTLVTSDGEIRLPPRFALGHDRVAMLYGERSDAGETSLKAWLFDTDGNVLGAPRVVPVPPFAGEASLVATPEGWLVVIAGQRSGLTARVLDVDGAPLGTPQDLDDPALYYSEVRVVGRADGTSVVVSDVNGLGMSPRSGVLAVLVDSRGSVVARAAGLADAYLAHPSLVTRDGRTFLLSQSPVSRLVVRELGCVP